MGFQALFIGGIKSGKSKNAEHYTLKISPKKPLYLATNEVYDKEMLQRIQVHKLQRENNFDTLEEPLHIYHSLQNNSQTVIIECISMWINNMLYHGYSKENIFEEIEKLHTLKQNIVCVINDVSCSVISENKLVREFVDINGLISQKIASYANEVFTTSAGISIKIK